MQAKLPIQIFCPVDLPIDFPLGLADAHTLLSSFKETANDFEKILRSGVKLKDADRTMMQEAFYALNAKIKDLDYAIYSAKHAYAHNQLAKNSAQ